jgi:hypothetical protein
MSVGRKSLQVLVLALVMVALLSSIGVSGILSNDNSQDAGKKSFVALQTASASVEDSSGTGEEIQTSEDNNQEGVQQGDQATVLAQIGLIDTKSLPITGVEQTRRLLEVSQNIER